jgi:hypothetical protein
MACDNAGEDDMIDKRNLIAGARRLNHDMQATIAGLLATAKSGRAPKRRSAKTRIRAVVEGAREVGMDIQRVEVDGVTVTAKVIKRERDEWQEWKDKHDANRLQRAKLRQQKIG